jgi:outer membrane protein TolC
MRPKPMVKTFFVLMLALCITANGYSQRRTLDYYISEALKSSPLLNDYENQFRAGSMDSLLSLAGFKPQVSVASQLMAAPYGNKLGYAEAITNGGNYTGVIGVTQSLLNSKVKAVQLENINLLKQSLGVNKTITQLDIKRSITLQYITAFADFDQMQFSRKMIDLLKEQQQAIKYLVETGVYQLTDMMNLSVTVTAQEINCKQVYIQFKNDIALLNLLSGIVDTSTVELVKPTLELTNQFNIQQSPVMLQFTIDSLKNTNSKSMVDLNYRPKLEAFADAGFMAVKPVDIPQNFGASFGLNFSMPIYDGKQRELAYKKIEIAEKSRLLYRDFYTTQFRQQYQQLYEQLLLVNDLIKDIGHQLSQQKELIDLYKKVALENGLVRFTDYLTAINNYVSIQNNLTITEMSRMQLINQLNFLK